MAIKKRFRWILVSAILVGMVILFSANELFGQTYPGGTRTQNYRCTAPTTGSLPTNYLWYVAVYPDSNTFILATTSTDTFAAVTVPKRLQHWVRVAARDAATRIGPISVCSLLDDPGAPGGCGRPTR